MSSIDDLNANIDEYANRTTPKEFPLFEKIVREFLSVLLTTGDVREQLDALQVATDPNSDTSTFLLELSPLVANYIEGRYRPALVASIAKKNNALFSIAGEANFTDCPVRS